MWKLQQTAVLIPKSTNNLLKSAKQLENDIAINLLGTHQNFPLGLLVGFVLLI